MSKGSIIATVLFIGAAVSVICFGIQLWGDYTLHYPYGSAPFYLYVLERAIDRLLPAGVCVVSGIVVLRRGKKCSMKDEEGLWFGKRM